MSKYYVIDNRIYCNGVAIGNRSIVDKLNELETKLAEYEKFMKDNEWNSIEEMQETLNKCEERYFNLQVQLISKDEQCRECKHLNKKIELNIKNKLMSENRQLQQELAEKDKELERIREINLYNKNLADTTLKQLTDKQNELIGRKKLCDLRYEQLKNSHHDKISFCIEQFEKVKEWCKENRAEDEFGYYVIYVDEYVGAEQNLLLHIDQLIKEIKGE